MALCAFSLPMFPDASAQLIWLVFGLSMVAVVYTSLVALVQNDMKKLIAYSSVAHMAFVTAGLFALNTQGIEGCAGDDAVATVLSRARCSCASAWFTIASTPARSRVTAASPIPCRAMRCCCCSSPWRRSACPRLAGFVAEFLVLLGLYQTSSWATFVMTTGIILGAAYMLWLYRRIAFGTAAGRRYARHARSVAA